MAVAAIEAHRRRKSKEETNNENDGFVSTLMDRSVRKKQERHEAHQLERQKSVQQLADILVDAMSTKHTAEDRKKMAAAILHSADDLLVDVPSVSGSQTSKARSTTPRGGGGRPPRPKHRRTASQDTVDHDCPFCGRAVPGRTFVSHVGACRRRDRQPSPRPEELPPPPVPNPTTESAVLITPSQHPKGLHKKSVSVSEVDAIQNLAREKQNSMKPLARSMSLAPGSYAHIKAQAARADDMEWSLNSTHSQGDLEDLREQKAMLREQVHTLRAEGASLQEIEPVFQVYAAVAGKVRTLESRSPSVEFFFAEGGDSEERASLLESSCSDVLGGWEAHKSSVYDPSEVELMDIPSSVVSQTVQWYTAVRAFKGTSPDELSFEAGARVGVHQIVSEGWARGEYNEERGVFPTDVLQGLADEERPEAYFAVTIPPREKPAVVPTMKQTIYRTLDDPTASRLALGINIFILLIILVSTVTFCVASLPQYYNDVPVAIVVLEPIAITVFTLEYAIKLFTCDSKIAFVRSPLNVIDLLAILPYFVELAIGSDNVGSLTLLRVVRLTRVFRLFKLGKYSSGFAIVVTVMVASFDALMLMMFLFFIAVVFSSSTMYYAELSSSTYNEEVKLWFRENGHVSPFQSIPMTFWWSIVTMTTVGYGDDVPITLPGKFIGAFTMLLGVLVVSFPITIIGANFAEAWEKSKKMKRIRERQVVRDPGDFTYIRSVMEDEFERAQQKMQDMQEMVEFIAKKHNNVAVCMSTLALNAYQKEQLLDHQWDDSD